MAIGQGPLESVGLMVNSGFWRDRRVFLTGHTGFKGGWLSLWLQEMGAAVKGYALAAPTEPSLFEAAEVFAGMDSEIADVRDAQTLSQSLQAFNPEIVFHLAAQPLVRLSYDDPIDTYSTNIMGTAHLLEACRQASGVRSIVVITSDKCYENREWPWGYRENEAMGGYDPYSSSKGCAELVTASYRQSFFNPDDYRHHGVGLASARAGNVIGGGDWALDRLVPDVLSAFEKGQPVEIRNPHAIRPWQHVLEPLAGYLRLAEMLHADGAGFAGPWNFGPDEADAQSVEAVVEQLAANWGNGAQWSLSEGEHPHEAHYLKLDCSKARAQLHWRPALNLADCLRQAVSWHKAWLAGDDMRDYSLAGIRAYMNAGAGRT